MDHHDPSKLHTAEHEGHGVHVCRKCGWHFPNAHPSAKLRRSHKRICGTIEGYKLAGSEENPHLNVSDDEHLSDEDHKPPSTEVLETSNNEKGSGGIGERSNRSEYELFSDAVAEFSDGGITSAIEERLEDIQEPAINVEKVAKDDPNTSQPLRDGTLVDIKPQEISFDSSQMGNPEFPESTTDKLGSKPRSEDYVPSPTTTSMASSGSDYITEESVLLGNDRKCSPNDVNILKPETLTDASQENEKANAGEDVTECSLACVGLEIDGKRTEESSLDKNLMDSMVSHSRIGGRSFEIASNLEGTFGKTSDLVPADKVEKEHEDGSIYKVSQKDLPLKVDSADHVDVYGDTSEVWVDAARGVKDDSSCNIFEIGNREEKGNCNVDVLAVHSDSAIHVNASIGTSDMKVDAAEGIDRANFGHKIESCSRDTDEKGVNANVLSLPDDMSIVDPPETVVEDFEDNEAVKLQKYAALDSCVTSMDKKAGAENFASKANSSSIQSGQLNEGAKVPTSDIHVLKDSDEEEGGTINIVVNEVIVEEKADVSQTNVTIDEPGAPAEVFTLDIDENHTAQACEDETNDIHNCDLHVSRPEDAAKFLSDNRSNIEINEAVKLQKYAALDSCVTSMDKEAGAENFASKANSSSIQSGQLNEGTKVPTSDIHVSKDSDEQEGGTINSVVNEVIVEEKAEVSQTNVTIDEPGAPAEVFTLDIDENHSVQAREEETNDIHNCDLHVSRPEDAAKFLSDNRSNIEINEAVKLQKYAALDSCVTSMDKEAGAENFASKANSSSIQSGQLNEGTKVPTSDIHVSKDSDEQEGGTINSVVNEVIVEEKAEVSQTNVTIDEPGAPAEVFTLDIDENHSVQAREEETNDIHNCDLHVSRPEDAAKFLSDNRSNIEINEAVKLQKYAALDSCVTSMDKEAGAENFASKANSSSIQSGQLNEGTKVPTSDIHVSKDSDEQEGGTINSVVNEVIVEEKAEVSQTNVTIDEPGAPAEVFTLDIDENHSVQAREEETNDIHNCDLHVSRPEDAAKFLSDTRSNIAINLVGVDDIGKHEKAGTERFHVVGDNNGNCAAEENITNISSTNPESSRELSVPVVDPTMNFPEGDEDGDLVKGNLEKCDIDRNESREESQENDLSMKPKLSSEFASSLPESQIFADDIMDVPVKEFPERESMHLHGVPYSSRIGNNSVSDTGVKDELKGDNKVGLESLSISTPTEYDGGDVDSLEKPFEDHRTKESRVSPIEDKSSVPVSAIAEDNHARELGGSAAEITSGSLEGDSNFVKQHIGASTVDVSVDSYSQADSLEGNWGSVSVLSIQSDAAAVIDAETLPSSDNQALAETEAAHSEKPKAVPERQPSDKSDKSDMFEAPSFMTLVEPRDGAGQKAAVSEVQTGQNRQQQSASLQAGWFPSLSHVANESPGRKKNEEIIAKVTNWSTGKQHTPLKSLLSQASFETKQKSKKPKENPASALQNDETLSKDNGATSTALYTVLGPESPTTQAAKTEPKKEWNSPARYPSEIKTEKRKVKGRPYWVPFVCCSSVN